MSETQNKIQRVQKYLVERGLEAVRLKGVDWFSWITCGGSSVVIFTAEAGIAEVLVTQNKAWVITNNFERDRLAAEELPRDFELVSFPWQRSGAADEFVKSKSSRCISDRPIAGEKPLPPEFLHWRLILMNEEVSRYRLLGRAAAEAMTQAISKAEPEWSERKLAGEGAQALWSRGLDPTLILVGSERRVKRFRHPVATNERLGDYAMMVFCARAFGLYANLTRFIFFGNPALPSGMHSRTSRGSKRARFPAPDPGQDFQPCIKTSDWPMPKPANRMRSINIIKGD